MGLWTAATRQVADMDREYGTDAYSPEVSTRLKSLAGSLPFQKIELPEFKPAAYSPTQVRQPRTFHSFDLTHRQSADSWWSGGRWRFSRPSRRWTVFKEIHWCSWQIRKLARMRHRDARHWHEAVVRARSLISEIEAAEEELFIANRRLVVSCIKPYFWIGQFWLADFLQEAPRLCPMQSASSTSRAARTFYVYSQKAVQNRLRNFFRDHIRSGNIGVRPTRGHDSDQGNHG
jgi:hypothetical protein